VAACLQLKYINYFNIMDLMNSRKVELIRKNEAFFVCIGFWSFELHVLKHVYEGVFFETWTLFE